MLSGKTGAYASSRLPAPADGAGLYFPDSVVAAFVAAAHRQGTPADPGPTPPSPRFAPEDSRDIIVAAMKEFDPALGRKAEALFNDGFAQAVTAARQPNFMVDWNHIPVGSPRWRLEMIEPPPPGSWQMMSSTPGHEKESEFGPANPNPYSIINFQYDGTINSLIYVAHEVGHSIADDTLRAKGFTNDSSPAHIAEPQAYLTQHILYDYIARHPELEQRFPGIGRAARHDFETMTAGALREIGAAPWAGQRPTDDDIEHLHHRPMAIMTSLGLFQRAASQQGETRRRTIDALMGGFGPLPIRDVLSMAGVEHRSDLRQFAQSAVAGAASPTPAITPRPAPAPNL